MHQKGEKVKAKVKVRVNEGTAKVAKVNAIGIPVHPLLDALKEAKEKVENRDLLVLRDKAKEKVVENLHQASQVDLHVTITFKVNVTVVITVIFGIHHYA